MATKQDLLIEANSRGLLTGSKKASFDEAVRRGIITPPSAPKVAEEAATAPVQQVAQQPQIEQGQADERQRLLQELAADVGPFEAAAIGAGRGLTTIGRAVGLAEPEDPITTAAFEELQEQRPFTTTAGEIVGEALPFLPAGVGIGAVRSLAPRVAASAGLGAAETTAIARGRGEGLQEQAEAGVLGGVVAGTIEAILPVVGRLGGSLVRRVTGKAAKSPVIDRAGIPSAELQQALDASGLSIDDLTGEAQSVLARAPQRAAPEEAVREAVIRAEGLAPTKAQVTRNAADFQAQQEAAKTSGRVRDALEKQEAILTTRFDQAVLETGGQVDTPTSTVTDALVGKASVLDQQVSDLYNLARDVAPGEKNVKLSALAGKLKELAPSDRAAGGSIRAVAGDLQAKGVLDENLKVVGKIDVETAEDARKFMNSLFDPQNGFGNGILRQLKDTLDDDVFKAAGGDVFKQGRQAKSAFEKDLSRAKISKFDSRKANLVRDVLENKLSPDTFTNDVVFSKKWRGDDIAQLKDYITDTPVGTAAFNDLRADVMDTIKNKAFIGPEDAAGNRALSRNALQAQIEKVGPQKMNVLFTGEERGFLNSMLKIAKLREPVRGTALGRGPSAQAIAKLEKKLADLPVIGALVNLIDVDVQGRVALKGSPSLLPRQAGAVETGLRGIAAPAGAALTIEGQR